MTVHRPWCAPTCTGTPHTSNPVTVLGGKTSLAARLLLPDGARGPIVEISAGWLALDRSVAYVNPPELADWWIRLVDLGRRAGV